MALQLFPNQKGILLGPGEPYGFSVSTGNITINAAGESGAVIGRVRLSSGRGTSKVLSAAGSGKIHLLTGAVTFANAGTNLRVGVNDVSSGLEDGTHDVFADLTGGGGGLTANSVNALTMTSGTKTIAHGDTIAIVAEMTARGGADSVVVVRNAPTGGCVTPYGTEDTGSGPTRTGSGGALAAIEFDDGTIGWMDNIFPYTRVVVSAFHSGSATDEYALVFRVPFTCTASGIYMVLGQLAATDDFEAILYSDPLGTPVAERTITQDMDNADVGAIFSEDFASDFTIAANTDYAIALRPTTTNSLAFQNVNFGSGGANLRRLLPFGTNCSTYSRADQTGAFGSQVTTQIPQFGLWISSFSDDVSSGGGMGARVIGGGF